MTFFLDLECQVGNLSEIDLRELLYLVTFLDWGFILDILEFDT